MTRSQPELFRVQAAACAQLGSPMYAELLAALADDIAAGGPTADVLSGHEDDPGPSGLALRLAGSVHRLGRGVQPVPGPDLVGLGRRVEPLDVHPSSKARLARLRSSSRRLSRCTRTAWIST